MFFSTLINDNVAFVIPNQIGTTLWRPAIIKVDESKRVGYGSRPKAGPMKNRFGDRECVHTNYTGEIFSTAVEDTRGPFSNPNGFPDYWELRTYITGLGVWQKITSLHTLGSGVYTHVTTPYKSGSYWIYYELFLDARKDEVRIEIVIYRSTNVEMVGKWRHSVNRRIHADFDFDKKSFSNRTSVVTGTQSAPAVGTPWEIIPLNSPTTQSASQRFKSSTQRNLHPVFDIPFWDRIFERPQFTTGLPDESLTFGDLVQSAVDSTRAVDVNTPAFVLDFFKIGQTLASLLKVASGNFSPKALADAFLSIRYGLLLTKSDTAELYSAIKKAQRVAPNEYDYSIVRRKASGVCEAYYTEIGSVVGEWQYNYKLYYCPYSDRFNSLMRESYKWDLYPSFQNLWDYIPFSFVLDWFIKVEEELERMDHNNYIVTLRIISNILTTRVAYPIPVSLLTPIAGTMLLSHIKVVKYNRRVVKTPPKPISRLETPTGSFNHWLEGAALFIQRMK